MKIKMDRIISIATLAASLFAIFLVLKKPAPVAQPQTSPAAEQSQPNSTSFQPAPQASSGSFVTPAPVASTAPSPTPSAPQPASPAASNTKPSAAANSGVSGALAALLGGAAGGGANLSLDSNVGSSMPNIKDQQITTEGDTVHGRFLTEIGGKDVWVTISGHMGEKDGYATFDPTEFKVGDMEVPVSLVNPALQRKLAEERDRLKVPNGPAQ
jgi:hypothetical protein